MAPSMEHAYGAEAVGTLSRRRPSTGATTLLQHWLLPGEPVLAAITGSIGLQTAWIVLTPTFLFVLRDTMTPRISGASLGQLTGWQLIPAWSGSKLRFESELGDIELTQMKEREIGPFVRSVEETAGDLVAGLPPSFQAIDSAFSEAVSCLDQLHRFPGAAAQLQDMPSVRVIASDIALACSSAILRSDRICHDLIFFIFTMRNMAVDTSHESRGEGLRALLASAPDDPVPTMATASLRDAVMGTPAAQTWLSLMRAIADCINIVKDQILPLGTEPSVRAVYDGIADAIGAASRAKPTNSSIEESLERIESLVGILPVKVEISGLVDLIRIQTMRQKHGLLTGGTSRHLVFTGNPGTGKTTVARLVASLYQALGVLPTGQLVEVGRSDLVAGFVGQTAIKTTEAFERARGGILFIDEAYTLARSERGEDFGQEAIDTLVKLMEDHREDTAVIVAGYPREMERFVRSNPGLLSRFRKVIDFPDYSDNELLAILNAQAAEQDYRLSEESLSVAGIRLGSEPRGHGFGNGRLVRQILESAILKQASRLVRTEHPTADDLHTLQPADFG